MIDPKLLKKHALWARGEPGGERLILRGADLSGADLREADLRRADLGGADLRWADLRWADLGWADLGRADLRWAILRGADLGGATTNWQSHDLVAEILRREAGEDPAKRAIAGLVLISRDWCWAKFLSLNLPEIGWARGVLRAMGAPTEEEETW